MNFLKNQLPDPQDIPAHIEATYTSLADFQKLDKAAKDLGLGKKRQKAFAPSLASLGQGNFYAVVGYLYYAIPGGVEACNCKLTQKEDKDFHIGIGFDSTMAGQIADGSLQASPDESAADPVKQNSVIVEMTPEYRNQYRPQWSLDQLTGLAGKQVKVIGQLLVDNEHNVAAQNCALAGHNLGKCWRASAWELHPVTHFFVCSSTEPCHADSDTGWTEVSELGPNQ